MSSLVQLVCLANSLKNGERCIAGIDLATKRWVRPICDDLYSKDGRVPPVVRLVEGQEPRLLDILEMRLAQSGNNFGFSSENRTVLPGYWRRLRSAQLAGLRKYYKIYEDWLDILHNSDKFVSLEYLQGLPASQRRTLQLVYGQFKPILPMGEGRWKGTIVTDRHQKLVQASITDPLFLEQLKQGYKPQGNYFVTVSLSMPWIPQDDPYQAPRCYKLIAGVIPDAI